MTILIIAFVLISLLFWLHSFFVLYHLIRFGIGTRPKQAALVFFVISLVLFLLFALAFIGILFQIPSLLRLINTTNISPLSWQ